MTEENNTPVVTANPFIEQGYEGEFGGMDRMMNMVHLASLMKRTEPVDTHETRALVKAALGNRSIRKFAEEIGISASSISRILNGAITELRSSTIAFIVDCADPKSGVTLDKLLKAQGFTKPENRRPVGKREKWESKGPISDEMLLRGYSVQHIMEAPDWSVIADLPTYIIQTNAFSDGIGKWLFYDRLCKKIKKVSIAMIQSWIDGIMASYYRGLEAKRVSIVVDSEDIFNVMKRMLGRYRIKDEISVILVSLEEGRVFDEFIVPLEDGTMSVSILAAAEESPAR